MDRQDRLHILVALVVLALIGLGYWLTTEMHRRGQLEQCLMARRRDCAQFGG